MTHKNTRPLRRVLQITREAWDRDDTRPAVREAFRKAIDCGTPALGAEVFASQSEERVVYHTCKSHACPSCGHRATKAWQRDQWRELPDVPYAHVCLTMPDVLWPLFRRNRHLLHDLPVLGAQALQQRARQKYGIRLLIVVIPHTFGRHLNFNPHLHILVSEGGLSEDGTRWCSRARLDRKAPDADVALRRHHIAAGSRAGRGARHRQVSQRTTEAPHQAVRTLVEHRHQAVSQQEAIPRIRGPIRSAPTDRATPVPGD